MELNFLFDFFLINFFKSSINVHGDLWAFRLFKKKEHANMISRGFDAFYVCVLSWVTHV